MANERDEQVYRMRAEAAVEFFGAPEDLEAVRAGAHEECVRAVIYYYKGLYTYTQLADELWHQIGCTTDVVEKFETSALIMAAGKYPLPLRGWYQARLGETGCWDPIDEGAAKYYLREYGNPRFMVDRLRQGATIWGEDEDGLPVAVRYKPAE